MGKRFSEWLTEAPNPSPSTAKCSCGFRGSDDGWKGVWAPILAAKPRQQIQQDMGYI